MIRKIKYLVLIILLNSAYSFAQYAPIILDPSYEHDKWRTTPQDLMFYFEAYTVSFHSGENSADGLPDFWGVPDWVSFEIKKINKKHSLANRPKWMTDKELYLKGIAPDDNSYTVSGANDMKEVKTDYRFVRGHMCPKDTAERISENAAYNTHTLLNAVPQLQWQNNGIWKTIEILSNSWADKYERVWVICGPVFFNKTPSMWLGQKNNMKVAIPDALFKIIIRTDEKETIKTIAFIIPNIVPKEYKDPAGFITSIGRIEKLTGLSFLTVLKNREDYLNMHGVISEW